MAASFPPPLKIFTKESLFRDLRAIGDQGFLALPPHRSKSHGGVGDFLEEMLGIPTNNLPIPNAAEWELKTQDKNSSSLVTLLHCSPSPTALRLVPQRLLPLYGWPHREAGQKYPAGEKSFRQTISAKNWSDRGFRVAIDRQNERKIKIVFDAARVAPRHASWLASVEKRAGLGQLDPQPYWGFNDLGHKLGAKLANTIFVQAERRRSNGRQEVHYFRINVLRKFLFEGFLEALERGDAVIDFDARTGHDHGSKIRVKSSVWPSLYESAEVIYDEPLLRSGFKPRRIKSRGEKVLS